MTMHQYKWQNLFAREDLTNACKHEKKLMWNEEDYDNDDDEADDSSGGGDDVGDDYKCQKLKHLRYL